MRNITIDVAIPNYNSIFLADTLKSVLNQNEGNFKLNIFVVDDGSNSNFMSKLQKTFEPRGVKFYLSSSNQGMVNNFNRCLDLATNEYVHILHSDDLVHTNYYNKLSAALALDSEIGLISCSSQSFYNGKYRPFTSIRLFGEHLFNHLKYRNVLAASSVIIKTEIGKKNRFSDTYSHNNDWHLWLRVSATSKTFYILDTLHTYRIHESNDTKKYSDVFILSEDLKMLTSLQDEGVLTNDDLIISKRGIVQSAMYSVTNSVKQFKLANSFTILMFIYKSLGLTYLIRLFYLVIDRYFMKFKRLFLRIIKKTLS